MDEGTDAQVIQLPGTIPVEEGVVVAHRNVDLPAILPPSLRSKTAARDTARFAARRATHRAAYHAVRVPRYAVRSTRPAGRGTRRAVRRWLDWVNATEWAGALDVTTPGGMAQWSHYCTGRRKITAGVVAGTAGALTWADVQFGAVALAAPGALAYLAAVLVGLRGEPPLLDTPDLPRELDLGREAIVEALRDAKLLGSDEGLEFVNAPMLDVDGNWLTVFDLPPGRLADTVIGKRTSLAAALRVDESQIVLERVRGRAGHAGRVSLWVAAQSPWDADRATFPLVNAPQASVWDGVPVGVDARGRQVTAQVMWTHWAVGASPRKGKTFLLLEVACLVVLDPAARLLVASPKPGDIKPLRAVAVVHCAGAPDLTRIERLAAAFEAEVTRMGDIYERLADEEAFPEGKITPGCGIEPTVIIMDEAHRYLMHLPDEKRSHEALYAARRRLIAALEELARSGPAAGYTLVLATQRLVDDAIPPSLLALCETRAAFQTSNGSESYLILGQAGGLDASKLPGPGVGILAAAGDSTDLAESGPVQYMTHQMDLRVLRAICERGRALREAAGTLTGDAAATRPTLVVAAVAVMDDAGVDRMPSAQLASALGFADAGELAGAMRGHDVTPGQLGGPGNPRGYRREDLHRVLQGAL